MKIGLIFLLFGILIVSGCDNSTEQNNTNNSNNTNNTNNSNIIEYNKRRIVQSNSAFCMVDENEKSWCWGSNYNGQFADGSLKQSHIPYELPSETLFKKLSVGSNFSCGLDLDDKAWCWGSNYQGETGVGSVGEPVYPPEMVAGDHTFLELKSGENFTCGIDNTNYIWCWGILPGSNYSASPEPVKIDSDIQFSSLYTAGHHVCALTSSGTAYCWGSNGSGELGVPVTTLSESSTPVLVETSIQFDSLALGGTTTCGVTSDGSAYCWGYNYSISLNGTHVPVNVFPEDYIESIVVSMDSFCNLTSEQKLFCSGYRWGGDNILNPVMPDNTFSSINIEYPNGCFIDTQGKAYCFGYNNFGQLGVGVQDPVMFDSATPLEVLSSVAFTQIDNGGMDSGCINTPSHVCGLDTTGKVWCWGSNENNQLGEYCKLSSATPILVDSTDTISELSGTEYESCALKNNGTIWCLKDHFINDALYSTLVEFPLEEKISRLAVGYNKTHSCALGESGKIICWQKCHEDAVTEATNTTCTPKYVPDASQFQFVSIGEFGCGIDIDGIVKCWDFNCYNYTLNSGLNVNVCELSAANQVETSKKVNWLGILGDNLTIVYEDGSAIYRIKDPVSNLFSQPVLINSGSHLIKELSFKTNGMYGISHNGKLLQWTDLSITPEILLENENFLQVSWELYEYRGICALTDSDTIWCFKPDEDPIHIIPGN